MQKKPHSVLKLFLWLFFLKYFLQSSYSISSLLFLLCKYLSCYLLVSLGGSFFHRTSEDMLCPWFFLLTGAGTFLRQNNYWRRQLAISDFSSQHPWCVWSECQLVSLDNTGRHLSIKNGSHLALNSSNMQAVFIYCRFLFCFVSFLFFCCSFFVLGFFFPIHTGDSSE